MQGIHDFTYFHVGNYIRFLCVDEVFKYFRSGIAMKYITTLLLPNISSIIIKLWTDESWLCLYLLYKFYYVFSLLTTVKDLKRIYNISIPFLSVFVSECSALSRWLNLKKFCMNSVPLKATTHSWFLISENQ
jgi:hypothetical protein